MSGMAATLLADKNTLSSEELFVATDIGESLLASLYLQMERADLLDTMFFGGVPTLREWLAWVNLPKSRYLGCFRRLCPTLDMESVTLAGAGWLWNITGEDGSRRADCNMVFLPEHQKGRRPEIWTAQMLDVCFDEIRCDVLYSTVPESNRASRLFAHKMGFTQHGPLPWMASWRGKPEAAWIGHLTKEQWRSYGRGK